MAKKGTAQVQFVAETSQFTKGITQINKSLSMLKSDLKVVNTSLKASGDNFEDLQRKENLLVDVTQDLAKKKELLTQKLEKAKDLFGDNSDEVNKLKKQINNVTTEEIKFTRELDDTRNKLDGLGDEAKTSGKHIKQLGDDFNKAEKEAKGFLDSIKEISLGTAIGNLVSEGLSNIISSVWDTVDAYEEQITMQGKLEASTKNWGYNIDWVNQKQNELYGYLKDDTATTNAITNLQGLELEQTTLGGVLDSCMGVWATYGDTIPIESLTESIAETVATGEVTGVLADTLNFTSGEMAEFQAKLDACTTKEERAQVVQDMLNQKYGESKKAYDEANGALNAYNESIDNANDASVTLAEALLPIQTAFNNLKAYAIDKLLPPLQQLFDEFRNVDFMGIAKGAIDGLATGIQTLTTWVQQAKDMYGEFKTKIEEAQQWVSEHETTVGLLAIGLGGLATAIGVYAIAQNLATIASVAETVAIGAYCTACGIGTAITTAFGTAVAFLTSPITLVILAITALIAIVYVLVKNWDEVKAFLLKTWDTIKEKAIEVWDGIKQFFSDTWNNIKQTIIDAWNGIKDWLLGIWEGIKQTASDLWNAIKEAISSPIGQVLLAITNPVLGVVNFLAQNWDKIKATATKVFNSVKEGIATAWNNVKSTTSNIWNGITSTISGVWNNIKSACSNAINNVKTTITNGFNTAKSTVTSVFDGIKSKIQSAMDTAKSIVTGAIDKIKSAFNFKWSLPDLKVPKISVTGGVAPYGIGGKGSLPKFSVTWNADGAIFKKPTIFNTPSGLQGVGEAGAEAILPLDTLWSNMDRMFEQHLDKNNASVNISFGDVTINDGTDINTLCEQITFNVKRTMGFR